MGRLPHLSELLLDREEVREWVWVKSNCDDCHVELRKIEEGYWAGLEHGYPGTGCTPPRTCTYCPDCAAKRNHLCGTCGAKLTQRAIRDAYAEAVKNIMADHNLPRDVRYVDPASVTRQALLANLTSKHNRKLNILKQRALEEAGMPTDGPLVQSPVEAKAAAAGGAKKKGGKK